MRLSSTPHHQDGIAHNPKAPKITALSDGMGGVGHLGDVKDNFAFALAHAAAELEDISKLQDPVVVENVVSRSRELLASMGIDSEVPSSRLAGGVGVGRTVAWGATLVAAQEVPERNGTYRVVIFGDNSAVKLGRDGRIKEGFGEAFQLINSGRVNPDGSAKEAELGSFVGMEKGSLRGIAQYGDGGLRAVFGEVNLESGESLVLTSDAYMQKTSPSVLEADAALTAEQWAAKAPVYGDDTSMAIIRQP